MDIEKLLSEMTLREKLGQLTQLNASFYKSDARSDITGPVSRISITEDDVKYAGSVLNVEEKAVGAVMAEATERQPHHIPPLMMRDVIHGYRTIYPIPLGLACAFDDGLWRECAAMAAKEAAAGGVHVTFAPMADLSRDARWGRCMESAGEDVLLNCRFASASVRGFTGDGGKYSIGACVKHFCGYGAVEAGRDYNNVELSERTLRECYLPAYKAAIDAGARWLMPSFNLIGRLPVHAARGLLRGILRDKWGFDGLVISDYNAYRELIRHGIAEDEKHAAELALDAGCEVEMMSATTYLHAAELIDEGKISPDMIDDAVRKILKEKDRLGLFDGCRRPASEDEINSILLCPEHRALARRAAEQSAVLLKNGGVLPISKSVKKLAVIGPFGDEHGIIGFWSCLGRSEESTTVLDGLRAALPDAEITYIRGCAWKFDADENEDEFISETKKAADAAKDADAVILCLGEYQDYSGEGNSRATLTLPKGQIRLARRVIAANPNTAAVIFGGRPLDLTELEKIAPAMLYMWQPGTEGGNAAARLLLGDAVPCGKLSMTFPRGVGQVPIYYSHVKTARPAADPGVITPEGYVSRYVDMPVSPLYPFGYGLSYTSFEYGGVSLDRERMTSGETVKACVCVKNAGNVGAYETVQMYIHGTGDVSRPVKELKAYKKIFIGAGETAKVSFEITEEMLRFWTKDMKYEAQSGYVDVFIGGDSDTQNKAEFVFEKC